MPKPNMMKLTKPTKKFMEIWSLTWLPSPIPTKPLEMKPQLTENTSKKKSKSLKNTLFGSPTEETPSMKKRNFKRTQMLRQLDVRKSLERTWWSSRSCKMVERRYHRNRKQWWWSWPRLNPRLRLQIICLCPPFHPKLTQRIRCSILRRPQQIRCWLRNSWMGWRCNWQWIGRSLTRKINRWNWRKRCRSKDPWCSWQIRRTFNFFHCWPRKMRNQSRLGLIIMVTRLRIRISSPRWRISLKNHLHR